MHCQNCSSAILPLVHKYTSLHNKLETAGLIDVTVLGRIHAELCLGQYPSKQCVLYLLRFFLNTAFCLSWILDTFVMLFIILNNERQLLINNFCIQME